MSQIRADLNLNCEKFLSAIKTVDNAISTLEHSVVGLAMGFKGLQFVGEGIAAQFEHLKASFELGAKLQELSTNTGQSVADMLLLRQAFDNAGMGADAVTPALFNLQKSLSGMNDAGEATKPVFDKLGLSIHALRDMTAVQQLRTIGEALRGIENPADRAKAAADLFGKAGQRLGIVEGGSEGEIGAGIGRSVLGCIIDCHTITETLGRHGRHATELTAPENADGRSGKDGLGQFPFRR